MQLINGFANPFKNLFIGIKDAISSINLYDIGQILALLVMTLPFYLFIKWLLYYDRKINRY
jgi:hypothetical protein